MPSNQDTPPTPSLPSSSCNNNADCFWSPVPQQPVCIAQPTRPTVPPLLPRHLHLHHPPSPPHLLPKCTTSGPYTSPHVQVASGSQQGDSERPQNQIPLVVQQDEEEELDLPSPYTNTSQHRVELPRRSCLSSGFPRSSGYRMDLMTSAGLKDTICKRDQTVASSVGPESGSCSANTSSVKGTWNTERTSIKNGRRTIKPKEDPDILDPTRRMRRRELGQFNPEEAERIVRRRERNKVAATKCRHKRRAQHEELVKELQSMECNNTSLTYEIRQLQRQRQALSDVLRHHQMSCSVHQLLPREENPHMDHNQISTTPGIPGPYPLQSHR